MTISDLDPRRTFDSFVVGPANRLASAAARRAADSPGTSYNPLFIYSAPGLGKSHLLVATAHRAKKVNPDLNIVYLSLESSLDGILRSLGPGNEDGGLSHLRKLDMLLLDDVERLAGHEAVEEVFVGILAELSGNGAQVVLASSQAPSEIQGMDHRLVSRFSGGLIVDIAAPELDTRVDIVRRMVEERGGELAPGIAELIGRASTSSVRELSEVVNRLLALQEVEGRLISQEEVPELLNTLDLSEGDEFGAFIDELAQDVATTVEVTEAPWRRILRGALDAGEAEGYNCSRLRHLLEQPAPPPDTRHIVERFTHDVDRLRAIRGELRRLGDPWPEAALGVLRDPDRMEEAEALLTSAYELTRPYPSVPESDLLEDLDGAEGARNAALQLLESEGGQHSPLYLWSSDGLRARAVLAGLGQTFGKRDPEAGVAFISVRDFAEDFIRALTAGVAGAWRERWWKVQLLLVERIQDLSGTERARDELFHLFEAVNRSGGRIALAGDCPPSRIAGIDDRIRARLERGRVVEAEVGDLPAPKAAGEVPAPKAAGEVPAPKAASSSEPAWDPVLGGHVLDAESLAGFPDLSGVEAGPLEEAQPARKGDLLEVDPSSFDSLDEVLVDGAAAGRARDGTEDDAHAEAPATVDAGPEGSAPSGPGTTRVEAAEDGDWLPGNEDVVRVWPRIEDLIADEWNPRPAAGAR